MLSNNNNNPNPNPKRLPIPPRMRSNYNLIGVVFYNFCKQTTVHGVNHLSSVRNQRSRIFWIMIVCGAALGFTVNLLKIVEKYLQYQVLSNTYHDYELFEFPQISFCNLNPIYVPPSKSQDYHNLLKWTADFTQSKKHYQYAYSFVPSLSDYLYIERKTFSPPGWSFIASCKYQGSHCYHRNFQTISMWPYGNCYSFKPETLNMTRYVNKNVIYKGYRPSFDVILYKSIDFPKELKMDFHQSISMPSGILLMLHEPDSYPYIFEGFLLDFFSVVDMKVTRKFHEATLKPCIKIRTNYTYIDPVTNQSSVYLGRWADCLYNIIQEEVVKNCNCLLELYPIPVKYQNLFFCKSKHANMSSSDLRSCLNNTFVLLQTKETERNLCYRDLCTHSSYEMVISQAKYPAVEERNSELLWLKKIREMEAKENYFYGHSDLASKALKNNIENLTIAQAVKYRRKDLLNLDFVNRNFMLMRVIAQSLFMDKVEEVEEYPVSRLLSDIGGCVGLWLGASLITIFELFHLVMDSAEILYNNPYYRYKKLQKIALEKQNKQKELINQSSSKEDDAEEFIRKAVGEITWTQWNDEVNCRYPPDNKAQIPCSQQADSHSTTLLEDHQKSESLHLSRRVVDHTDLNDEATNSCRINKDSCHLISSV